MTDTIDTSTKPAGGSARKKEPSGGGDPHQRSQQWDGGSKGSKGPVTAEDRSNEQSSAKR
jgi:hypothetical protein